MIALSRYVVATDRKGMTVRGETPELHQSTVYESCFSMLEPIIGMHEDKAHSNWLSADVLNKAMDYVRNWITNRGKEVALVPPNGWNEDEDGFFDEDAEDYIPDDDEVLFSFLETCRDYAKDKNTEVQIHWDSWSGPENGQCCWSLYENGDSSDKMIERMQEYLAENPHDTETWLRLGFKLEDAGYIFDAINAYQHAEWSPDYDEGWVIPRFFRAKALIMGGERGDLREGQSILESLSRGSDRSTYLEYKKKYMDGWSSPESIGVWWKGTWFKVENGSLDLNYKGITNIMELKGIEKLVNLKRLSLQGNAISYIDGLDTLKKLEFLNLNCNGIAEIGGLDECVNLQTLLISQNKLTYIGGMQHLKNLEVLDLSFNHISGEGWGLLELVSIKDIYLNHNEIEWLEMLPRATKIRTLDLSDNKITMIGDMFSYLSHDINKLELNNNLLSSIEGLEDIGNLKKLGLEHNRIKKIECLETLLKLNHLDLGKNQITSIEGLDALVNLKVLMLDGNKISCIEKLESLVKLKHLALNNNNIEKIEGLEKVVNLEYLTLNNNNINKIQGLDTLLSLKVLILHTNQISSIEGLDTLVNLRKLDLGNNQITLIQGLDNLAKLRVLDLSRNPYINSDDADLSKVLFWKDIEPDVKSPEGKMYRNAIKKAIHHLGGDDDLDAEDDDREVDCDDYSSDERDDERGRARGESLEWQVQDDRPGGDDLDRGSS